MHHDTLPVMRQNGVGFKTLSIKFLELQNSLFLALTPTNTSMPNTNAGMVWQIPKLKNELCYHINGSGTYTFLWCNHENKRTAIPESTPVAAGIMVRISVVTNIV